ncbi:hypothetical protein [Paenarthrobacter nitroguajacolicus]
MPEPVALKVPIPAQACNPVRLLCYLNAVKLMSPSEFVFYEGSRSPSFPDGLLVAFDVKTVSWEGFIGAVDGEVETAAVGPFKVEIEVRLFGSDLPNVASGVVILCAQNHEDLLFAHDLILITFRRQGSGISNPGTGLDALPPDAWIALFPGRWTPLVGE